MQKVEEIMKLVKVFAFGTAVALAAMAFSGSAKSDWESKYDTSLPDLDDGNWVETLHTDFTTIKNMDELLAAKWAPSPHGLRNVEYWCPQMIEFTDQGLVIHSERQEDHECDVCGVSEGIFTGGIETRVTGENARPLFTQAYGYFEATVIVPRGTGMWSAFWLQSDYVGKVGHQGKDGTEIDVYESSFGRQNPTQTGQALHYDAYDAPWYRSQGSVADVGYNLYDGQEHTYALKWTPEAYVFYVDGKAVWASDYGGVSTVPECLRLTVEIRPDKVGPYAQDLGPFENHSDGTNDFIIKDVKVYQNNGYVASVKSDEDYKDLEKTFIGLIAAASAAGAAALITGAVFTVKAIRRRKTKNK